MPKSDTGGIKNLPDEQAYALIDEVNAMGKPKRNPEDVEELIAATLGFLAFRGDPNPHTAAPFMRWLSAIRRLEPEAVEKVTAKDKDP